MEDTPGMITCIIHVFFQIFGLENFGFRDVWFEEKTARPQNKVFSRPPICENAILRCGTNMGPLSRSTYRCIPP